MNPSALFINRPIATILLSIGIALSGILAFYLLPVSSLPQIEFPTIIVQSSLPGASPEIMATSVATPIEKQLSRIAGISDMTSNSSLGSTKIIIQFDLDRDINGAARDVQAAINASIPNLPSNIPSYPTYRKVNPSDPPIIIIGLTSNDYTIDKIYEYASTILQQRVMQIEGIGQVIIGGSSLPAVRVEVNPKKLNKYNISLSDIRSAIKNANTLSAKGQISDNITSSEIAVNDVLFKAKEYENLIITHHNDSYIRLNDVAKITDSVQDIYNLGLLNGKQAVALVIYKQPGANVIEAVESIIDHFPSLKSMIPAGIKMEVIMDRTTTIKASLRNVEKTLILSMLLVTLVVFVFLGNFRAMLIPSIAMTLSLLGTFAIMKLLGFSLNNLSLMALTIATGFVVDDAIVVLENISRYMEMGLKAKDAALKGAKEISFTVTSISISLVAVFIPILCMGGIVGRLFREFAVTLSVAILISLVVSLTLTPMMCSVLLKSSEQKQKISWLKQKYEILLKKALSHHKFMLFITVSTVCLSVFLFIIVPKGFFPQQDTGRIMASIVTDQDTSFQLLKTKFTKFIDIVKKDDAVKNVIGFIGSSSTNSGSIYISLKDIDERKISADAVTSRLREKLRHIAGATLYMQTAQDITIGGKPGNAQFLYTISADSIAEVNAYTPLIMKTISDMPGIIDLNNDQRDHGLQSSIKIDYDQAARLGISIKDLDNCLYSSFGQSIASTMYGDMNQYYVILEVEDKYSQTPNSLKSTYVKSSSGIMVPLSSFASFGTNSTLLSVNHQGLAPAATLSFNLLGNTSLGDVVSKVSEAVKKLNLPVTLRQEFRGAAKAFQLSLKNEPYLIAASLLAVYIVLGMLYESLIHPITIISTLPSAGVGAILALLITKTDLTVIAIIGVILLIGIVKKNAIMVIDFVLEIKKHQNISSEDAIFQAAMLRFRPIMMTTMSALLGALPLALGTGFGDELRKPLGITIVGGLIVSQMLTLFTTPIIYLFMEKFSNKKEISHEI